MLIVVFPGAYSWAQKPERPLRAVIPPAEEETAPTEESKPKEREETAPPKTEKAEPPQTAAQEKEATAAKAKSAQELEEEKKQRAEYIQAAQELLEKLEYLRITVQFGGEGEEFKKRLLEAGFALYRAESKARGPVSQVSSLGYLEAAANNFARAKDSWEQARNKKEEAEQAYQRAETAFPDSQRRYYKEQTGGLTDLANAPWYKDYVFYKEKGDTAKRESEQQMQTRDSYLNAAYASLDSAKEALKAEGKEK